jgi:hypothetical protein
MRGVHRECMTMTHLTPPMAPRIRAMTSSLMVPTKGKRSAPTATLPRHHQQTALACHFVST